MEVPSWKSLAYAAVAGWLGCLLVLLAVIIVDTIRRRLNPMAYAKQRTALYIGRVWHSRYHPKPHKFTYPIFYCAVDLDELDSAIPWSIWPLASSKWPALARFEKGDHFKGADDGLSSLPLAERVRQMVEKAAGKRPSGPIMLLTHLTYLGYCFNPVSFYYVFSEESSASGNANGNEANVLHKPRVETIVGEVSNTPWLEMHSYVLTAGVEGVEVVKGVSRDNSTVEKPKDEGMEGLRFKFPKQFHVSPFMGMDYTYDWSFSQPGKGSDLWVRNSMFQGEKRCFDAKLRLERIPFTASNIMWCLAAYPAYCAWVQVLIHFEAFKLFMKVPFYPHPEGAETGASKVIAALMQPVWALQAALAQRKEGAESVKQE
ncbi:unnamed protein product [Chrysoparadoxa australica]